MNSTERSTTSASTRISWEDLVDRGKWIDEARFRRALSYLVLLPGAKAQQFVIYVGWLMHRTWGRTVVGAPRGAAWRLIHG